MTTTKLTLERRIRAPIDHLVMQPLDNAHISSKFRSKNLGFVTWLLPTRKMQQLIHPRYQVEEVAKDEDGNPYGVFSIVSSVNYPAQNSFLERTFDPAPHYSVSVKTSVVDRIFWQRTGWNFRTYTSSLAYGKLAHTMYGADIKWRKPAIDCVWNEKGGHFDSYKVSVPDTGGLAFELEDTKVPLFDPKSRIVDGFTDNESALRVLAMHRETNMRANEGQVYRQPMWSTFFHPNNANLKSFSIGSEILQLLQMDAWVDDKPIATWILDEIEETRIFTVEGHVEDENDPASASHYNQKTFKNRIQQRSMNRHDDVRDDIRSKVYSDQVGGEVPRN